MDYLPIPNDIVVGIPFLCKPHNMRRINYLVLILRIINKKILLIFIARFLCFIGRKRKILERGLEVVGMWRPQAAKHIMTLAASASHGAELV